MPRRGPNVDVVGHAEDLPFADSSVDGVVLQAVLEQVEDGDATLSEFARVLRPGGSAHIEIPFMQGYHASPGDYRPTPSTGLSRRSASAASRSRATELLSGRDRQHPGSWPNT